MVENNLDITFANEQEIMSLIGTRNFKDVIQFAKKIKKLLIITRGAKGSVAISDDKVVEHPAKENLNILDLTGAGDLFAGGFLHGYVNKQTIKESLEIGTEMSSKVIQIIGARIK